MFVNFDSFEHAQAISDQLTVDTIHKKLDIFADKFCPVIKKLEQHYHWSIMQAEYATARICLILFCFPALTPIFAIGFEIGSVTDFVL